MHRARCRTDRRQVLCWIETLGTQLLSDLERPMRDAARRRLAGLDARDLDSLITLMEAVRTEKPVRSRANRRQTLIDRQWAGPRRQGETR